MSDKVDTEQLRKYSNGLEADELGVPLDKIASALEQAADEIDTLRIQNKIMQEALKSAPNPECTYNAEEIFTAYGFWYKKAREALAKCEAIDKE